MLFFQVSATVIPALLVASAITVKGFGKSEEDDSGPNAFLDAFGILLLLGAEALAVSTVASGKPSRDARQDISLALLLALLVLAGELAGPRLLAAMGFWKKWRSERASRLTRLGALLIVLVAGALLLVPAWLMLSLAI